MTTDMTTNTARSGAAPIDVERLETIVALARLRERAEEAWADALAQRGHAQAMARIGTERAEAILALRRALDEYARLIDGARVLT